MRKLRVHINSGFICKFINVLFLSICLIVVLNSCTEAAKNRRMVKRLYGKELIFPCDFITVTKDTVLNRPFKNNSETTIVTYLDSVICSKCAINVIIQNNGLFSSYDSTQFKLLIIIGNKDQDKAKKYLSELNYQSEVYIDNGDFFMKNNLSTIHPQYRTFLLDKSNKIQLIGDPFLRYSLYKLYDTTIKELLDKKLNKKEKH